MNKPKRLRHGDKVAVVSLSSGIAGEPAFIHRYELGKKRLEQEFGLEVIPMPNALKGIEYLDRHPEARAKDLMTAFQDSEISGVISMIGGDDTIRLLPHIDFEVIRSNPKIFMGYSDTTINHFMMYKAGLVSFYGPCVFAEFAENKSMHEYTKRCLQQVLFEAEAPLPILPSQSWTSEFLDWADANNNEIARTMVEDHKGFELLQGSGIARGTLLGGCVDVLPMLIGTSLWPAIQEWDGVILFLETSEEYPTPASLKYLLRGFMAQGILERINGVIIGKPKDENYYEDYKEVLLQVLGKEVNRPDLPILYNMNFGHTSPICTLPYGVMAEINCSERSFRLLESAVS